MLEDEAVQLKHDTEEITLIGLSDPDFTIKGDVFREAPAMVRTKLSSLVNDESSYTILLSHRPELFESYARCSIDLVLSGHAHEMCIRDRYSLPHTGHVLPLKWLFLKPD